MFSAPRKKVVLVLGMHRSGTSAITRGLAALGVDLGENLMQPIKGNNDKGFFEDVAINSLNVEMLNSIGHEWHSLRPVSESDFKRLCDNESFVKKAKDTVIEKLSNKVFVGIKDPRLSKLAPFWLTVLNGLNLDVKILVACRSPISVAESLQKRDRFPYLKSFYMWMDHNLNSLHFTKDISRLVVDYDRLIDSPRAQLIRIADYLALDLALNEASLSEYISTFLDDSLRHTKHSTQESETIHSVPVEVRELHLLMSKMAAAPATFAENDTENGELEALSAKHLANKHLLTLYDYSEDTQRVENAAIAEQIQAFEHKLSVLTVERDTLCSQLEEANASLSRAQTEFEKTIHASTHTQAYLVDQLQQASQKWELAAADLAKIQNSRIYKYLARFI